MRFFIILAILFSYLNLNGQNRTIVGRVIDEDLEILPEVSILTTDKLLLGKTNIDGQFIIHVNQEIDKLYFSWICMEPTEINLRDNCDTIEIVMMYHVIYDFMSSKKIDRLRKKRFNKIQEIHSEAFSIGVFTSSKICFGREFKPQKPLLDKISKELKVKRKIIKEAYKELTLGDTIKIPYSGTWRHEGTDRTTLSHYSYIVDGEKFNCIIKGIIVDKNKRKNEYNLTYKVLDCRDCNYDNIVLNGEELIVGKLIEYNMKFFKLLINK